MNEGDFMVVQIFFISSIVIVLLFTLNKIRITEISIRSFLTLIKWYVTALVVYIILSSNQYYFKETDVNNGLNLGVLSVISFGSMLYIHEYSREKKEKQKLKDSAITSELVEEKDKNR